MVDIIDFKDLVCSFGLALYHYNHFARAPGKVGCNAHFFVSQKTMY